MTAMEFITAYNQKRPVRLSQSTREFAWESLQGKYGSQAMQDFCVHLDDISNFDSLSAYQRYDCAIQRIAQTAPVRICDHELVSGAATLGASIHHCVPAKYNDQIVFSSVSHVTLDFARVVHFGVDDIQNQITARLNEQPSPTQREVLFSMQNTIKSLRIWHSRYLDATKNTHPEIYKTLQKVPFSAANSFREAVQSLWFTFAFTRLCGNWPGIGRIDEMLGDYLKNDLANGRITLSQAREILASMFIKGCEWIQADTPCGSGDAQHYQNIVLAGINADGDEVTNAVTYLVLDIIEELGISDFPVSVRVNEHTPTQLLKRMAEVIRHGGGVVAVYNEPLVIRSLVDFGYPLREARCFANDGCWEVQIPGKTLFSYMPFDALQVLLDDTLGLSSTPRTYNSMEELYNMYKYKLHERVQGIAERFAIPEKRGDGWFWGRHYPCSAISFLESNCIQKARSYYDEGAEYTVLSPHIGGAPDVGNSLYAIQKLVFDDKLVSFAELMKILQNDWEGQEPLRQYAMNKYTYYGNDDDQADYYTAKVLDDFADITLEINKSADILFPPGVSTFGRELQWIEHRHAVPFGYKKGAILSGNASVTPGTDLAGATAVIKSYCKAQLVKQVNGAALDIRLHPSEIQKENGTSAISALISGFVELGGYFMQLDVVDVQTLRAAQLFPERYKTLSVRVSGWNARFVTLDRHWQELIIAKNERGEGI